MSHEAAIINNLKPENQEVKGFEMKSFCLDDE
jgi:hypothetical protein